MQVLHGRSDNRDSTSLHKGVFNPLYGVCVHLKPGDLIIAEAEAEVTSNEKTSAVLSSACIIVATQRYGIEPVLALSDDNGLNITPEMHHYTHARCGSVVWAGPEGTYWVNFIGYWDPDPEVLSDGTLEATNRSYGHIGVTVIRPGAGETIGALT